VHPPGGSPGIKRSDLRLCASTTPMGALRRICRQYLGQVARPLRRLREGRKELVSHEMPGIILAATVAHGTDSPAQVADIDRTT
jgi:hypothetical protein